MKDAGRSAMFSQRDEEATDFTDFFFRPESFVEYLKNQLGQMKDLDDLMTARCLLLIDSLNSSGYLDCPLEKIAEGAGQSLFDMEQALFVVQTLDPPGVGARDLSECLLLQLAEGRHFTELNVRLIRYGLPLIAKRDMRRLCSLLNAPKERVQQAIQIVSGLNPIPSRGFATEETIGYVQPEAMIRCEDGKLYVDMNDCVLPRVSLDPTYCAMIAEDEFRNVRDYLKKEEEEAKILLHNLDNRKHTISRVLCAAVQVQERHFLYGDDLHPITMQELANLLDLNISTVSRAVRGKYIQFGTRVFPARDLFSTTLQTAAGNVSAEAVKRRIRSFIAAEDLRKPLSDLELSHALAGVGIKISRRTVAKYRDEMAIPTANIRKQ